MYSQIEIGDDVLAYNETTGETGEYTVTDTISHIDQVVVHLVIDGELIETTPEHPFYTIDGEWVEAENLTIGDLIWSLDGDYGTVQDIDRIHTQQPMYNLTVDEAHTFFVGSGDWLVHNDCDFYLTPDTSTPNWHYHDFRADPGNPSIGHGTGKPHPEIGDWNALEKFLRDRGFNFDDWKSF